MENLRATNNDNNHNTSISLAFSFSFFSLSLALPLPSPLPLPRSFSERTNKYAQDTSIQTHNHTREKGKE